MRAGRSLTAAVIDADASVRDARVPFPDVVHAVRRGRSIGEAFRGVAADPSTPIGLAAPVLATCAELGGPNARPIEGVADILVARADERAERRTASAQARLSARVLSIVPFAVAVLLAVTEPSVRLALATPAWDRDVDARADHERRWVAVDDGNGQGGVMSGAIAVTTGALAMALILALGAAARPRASRRRTPPTESDDDAMPRRRRSPLFLGAFLVGGGIALVGVAPLVVIGAGVLLVRRHRRSIRRRRHRQDIEAALPDAVELLVLCIRAGCSPTQAVRELVARAPPPLRPAFAAVDLSLHRGRSLADALGSLADDAGPIGRDVARAIATAERDGQPLAPVLDRLAADARTARRRLGEAAARRLPVRLTFPLVTCTLPSFVLLAIAPAVLGALSTLRDRTP